MQIKSLSYDPSKDFKFISKIYEGSTVVVTSTSRNWTSLREAIAEAKKEPGRVAYASFGPGTPPQLLLETLAKVAGVKFTEVFYKGAAPALQDLLTDRIALSASGYTPYASMVAAGKLTVIAVTGKRRMAILPNVPTIAEQGYEHFLMQYNAWAGVVGPASLPQAIADQLVEAIRAAFREPKLAKFLTDNGLILVANSPAEFEREFRQEFEIVPKIMREDLHITPQ